MFASAHARHLPDPTLPPPPKHTHTHPTKIIIKTKVTVVVSSRREEFDVDARSGQRVNNNKAASPGGKGGGRPPAAIFDNESICVLEVCGDVCERCVCVGGGG